jgi:trigger factor
VELHVERTGPCVAKVSFSVPPEEFDVEVRKLLAEAGRNVRMKGFRPGHVPAAMIEKQHGKALRQEVRQKFLQEAYQRALEEEKLKPLAHPRVDLPEKDQLAGAPFSLEFEVSLRPEIELGAYTGLEVESELEPILDQHVANALEQLAQSQAHPEPAGEAGLPENGMALCKVELLYNGEVVLTRERLRLGAETAVPGVDPEAFKSKMLGARDQTSFELPVQFPEDFEREEARGKSGTCRVTVEQAFRIVMPERSELMRVLGVDGEEALLAKVREKLEEAHKEREDRRVETALIDRLIASHEMDLPESMIAEQVQARLAAVRRDLESQGVPAEALEQQIQGQEQAARESALRASKGYFLIEAIAQKEGLQVSEEELNAELRAIAARNRASFDEVRDYYREQNLFGQLAMEIVERKVRQFLRERAVVKAPA